MMPNPIDITGEKYGLLTAVKYIKSIKISGISKRIWEFKCDCGKVVTYNIGYVRSGRNISCGCRSILYKSGNTSPAWKGGRRIKNGYVLLWEPSHPNSDSTGYVREHTKVMSEKLGRPLYKNEKIHHKNGCRHDNNIHNLELWAVTQPSGQRVEDLLEWAREIIKTYDN